MFGFRKKIEIKTLDINDGYREYIKQPNHIKILCADEVVDYDNTHIAGSECLPLRIMDRYMEKYYPNKDMTYYVYSVNKAISERAYKKLVRLGYKVYSLGSYLNYHEEEEGLAIKKKRRKR